ncbi:glutamate-5-semialdehyde dehydrogenase [Erysipelothrix inopinata]|uniref:Gamma-glutamyl phosphate reductase n=1 Tax=Erysipelothrix inopinata TaxID=225084 RepID=A0A7G9S0K4_9FIRM|nr:glutamate-5-semialdehyde dehydrogenase [Erysipelothrix inopinata]QNN61379.1 glutamate-5-semialdehyde dehydrogenase [Erysipelothrix inopinata]
MLEQIGKNAKKASLDLLVLETEQKNAILCDLANNLESSIEEIITENQKDLDAVKVLDYPKAFIDRLTLDHNRIIAMAAGLKEVANIEDPIGKVLETITRPNGLVIDKVSVPLGVIGIIYEARPNVTIDAFSLCFKSGNAVILKGGKEAINTNIVLEKIVQETLESHNLNPYSIQVIKSTDRETTHEMMKMNKFIDVLIPRGSAQLIRAIVENSTIPVIETGSGNCHIYVDEDGDLDMSIAIIENAKLQRLGVCNTMESLVVHEKIADQFIPTLVEKFPDVEFYGDKQAQDISPIVLPATDEDFYTEYLDKKMSVKIVGSVEEAVEHINEHNTKHSESIITNNDSHAKYFTQRIDSSTVYVNASTRFTDGSVFGFGAEIGISTQKLHARGPMGVQHLTSYKYIVHGNGQIR